MTLSQVLLITSVVYNFIVDENAKVGLHVKQNKHVIFLPSSRITKILGLRTPGLMDGKRE